MQHDQTPVINQTLEKQEQNHRKITNEKGLKLNTLVFSNADCTPSLCHPCPKRTRMLFVARRSLEEAYRKVTQVT